MPNPYVGEIRLFAGGFPPSGWAFCHGQALSTDEYEVLFEFIGTTYGGDGQDTFNLPDLRGRVPIHRSSRYALGGSGGTASVTLTAAQMPSHTHVLMGSEATANATSPAGNVLAHLPDAGVQTAYGTATPFASIDPTSIGPAGGAQPHSNMQPYTAISFIISLYGVRPTQSVNPYMVDPFIAEIRAFAFDRPPTGWAKCDGALLPLSQNTNMLSLIGTRFGGDGKYTIALPDLRGRAPLHLDGIDSGSYPLGDSGGSASVELAESELPVHTHRLSVSTGNATEKDPRNSALAVGQGIGMYGPNTGAAASLATEALRSAGGGLAHDNMQPSLAFTYCIALWGVFPSRD